MVTVEALDALDLMIWLGSGARAAEFTHCNQSTMSRRVKQTQAAFNLKLQCIAGAWEPGDNSQLLQLERQLHQRSRFLRQQHLRLQAPYWSSEALFNNLPPCWISNPFSAAGSPHHCLELLKHRVVDACVATLPERPASNDSRFACFDLFHSPIHLVASPAAPVSRITQPSRAQIGSRCHIATFPFNPHPQKLFIRSFYAHHFKPSRSHRRARHLYTEPVYFANSLMLKALGDRMPVSILEVAVPSHYVESLVVLHENREEPAVAQLVEVLRHRILELSRSEAQLIAVR
jgi:DNA-binding transcriptional LysR family regulator